MTAVVYDFAAERAKRRPGNVVPLAPVRRRRQRREPLAASMRRHPAGRRLPR